MSLKFLIIQTSFLGDVILATSVIEKLHAHYPHDTIDLLVRKGNETVLQNNPKLNNILVWEKGTNKLANLMQMVKLVRKNRYDYVINLHRFASSGFITFLSSAKFKIGFHNNPFSFCYSHKFRHHIGHGMHEVERNQQLIEFLTDRDFAMPKIYPSESDFDAVKIYKSEKYICIAPGSVWATKRLPVDKWVELCNGTGCRIYIIGAPNENDLALEILSKTTHTNLEILCLKLTILQSAALIKEASMNYVNDSAPLHLCSATNALCTAFFCSTIPEFGFGPLSVGAITVQSELKLACKPCGIHGFHACPLGHFKCGTTININSLPTL